MEGENSFFFITSSAYSVIKRNAPDHHKDKHLQHQPSFHRLHERVLCCYATKVNIELELDRKQLFAHASCARLVNG